MGDRDYSECDSLEDVNRESLPNAQPIEEWIVDHDSESLKAGICEWHELNRIIIDSAQLAESRDHLVGCATLHFDNDTPPPAIERRIDRLVEMDILWIGDEGVAITEIGRTYRDALEESDSDQRICTNAGEGDNE